MVDPFKGVPHSFGALYVRCDLCRRFALLQLGPPEVAQRRLSDKAL